MATFDKLTVGQILYDRHTYKTNVKGYNPMGEWRVKVIELYPETKLALCSWNGNPPQKYTERALLKLKVKPHSEKHRDTPTQ